MIFPLFKLCSKTIDVHKIYFDTYMLLHPEVKRLHPMDGRSISGQPAGSNQRRIPEFYKIHVLKLAGQVEFSYHWKPYKVLQQIQTEQPDKNIEEYGHENS